MARTARTFQITRVLAKLADGSETFSVPGLSLTLAELQACVDDARIDGTHQVLCDDCGESVADCPQVSHLLANVPASWSWREDAFDGMRHEDGLVIFTG